MGALCFMFHSLRLQLCMAHLSPAIELPSLISLRLGQPLPQCTSSLAQAEDDNNPNSDSNDVANHSTRALTTFDMLVSLRISGDDLGCEVEEAVHEVVLRSVGDICQCAVKSHQNNQPQCVNPWGRTDSREYDLE